MDIDLGALTTIVISFSKEHFLAICLGIIIAAVLVFVFFRNRSKISGLEDNIDSISKQFDTAFDAAIEADSETGAVNREKVVIIKTVVTHAGIGLRVIILPILSVSPRQLLLYADNDDFYPRDAVRLRLLQNGDELDVEYFVPNGEADDTDVFKLIEWEITKLALRI